MQRITESLLRKRSEHNELQIGSLQEISLHQEDIGWIENIQNWCKDLKILLLQSNLISRIENLGKLKKLEYLNLSLNNIEKIENLKGCESLNKLDLTLNFIGDLISVESLSENIFLETLYLTGNPCTDYEGYRHFVVGTLPSLKSLDGVDITPSERILAAKALPFLKNGIMEQQNNYFAFRQKQKQMNKWKMDKWSGNVIVATQPQDPDVAKEFWDEKSDHSPETRVDIALRHRLNQEAKNPPNPDVPKLKPPVRLFRDGNPLNVNQAKVPFVLHDDDATNTYRLEVKVYKHLDTELIDADVHPNYVTVLIKNKVFQLTLLEEVSPSQSVAVRSSTTGHLIITMPKVKQLNAIGRPTKDVIKTKERKEIEISPQIQVRSEIAEDEVPPLE